MSTNPLGFLLGVGGAAKEVELIKTIAEKTRQQKITWQKTPTAYSAAASGLHMSFIRTPGMFLGENWQLLSIKTADAKKEILKLENESSGFAGIATLPGARAAPLVAADELFSVVSRMGQGDVDRAIDAIKKL